MKRKNLFKEKVELGNRVEELAENGEITEEKALELEIELLKIRALAKMNTNLEVIR